jgi:hypothetical protein
MIKDKRRFSVLLSIVIVLVTWVLLVGSEWKNDGLWYQGDSPRHAANGIFWKDFLFSGSLNPHDYALRYYARYPVISPTSYPPVFYFLEAALFLATGLSPHAAYAAKALVLGFALLACFYLIAWIRRWISPDAGWEAALLLLLPGFVLWSNAIMLNVPATALAFAALYHAKRWIELHPSAAAHRQLYLFAALYVLATLTYVPAGIVAAIVLAWVLFSRRWTLLWNWRTLCVGAAAAAFLAPAIYIILKWSPIHAGLTRNVLHTVRVGSRWVYYLRAMPDLVGPLLLVLATIGFVLTMIERRFRRESFLLFLFFSVGYLSLTLLGERSPRYALLLCIPLVCYCSMGLHTVYGWLRHRMTDRVAVALALMVAILIFGFQARIAAQTNIPRIQGIREVVAFMGQVAPKEPVFYDGHHDGIFTFYLRAADPAYQRQVVLGSKLLYASAIMPGWSFRSYVTSAKDVVQSLQTRGGCRWLAIEINKNADPNPAAQLLREAVRGPEFDLVRSFPLSGSDLKRIDVYRFKAPIQMVDELDLPFQVLGDGVRLKMRPIQR